MAKVCKDIGTLEADNMGFNVVKGQGTTVEIAKIGNGTMDDPFRPDTDRTPWGVVEENTTTFIIETFDTQKATWLAE